jgi:GH35 family endo-1,4-beta-xylanase
MTLLGHAANYVPLEVAGFNEDLIAEGSNTTAMATTSTRLDFSNVTYGDHALYSQGFCSSISGPAPQGLPVSGSFASDSNPHIRYQLAPYTQNNALLLRSASDTGGGGVTQGTLTLVSPDTFSDLAILGTSSMGDTLLVATLSFSDGSSTTVSLSFYDWFYHSGGAISGFGRVSRDNDQYEAAGMMDDPTLYEQILHLSSADQARVLRSVSFTWSSSSGVRCAIFGLSAVTARPLWHVDANAHIEMYRKRDANVRFVDPWGIAPGGLPVEVRQIRHEFGFGSSINSKVLSNPNYAAFFRTNFEWAVFENEATWPYTEPAADSVSYATADAIGAWCESKHIRLRGDCVFEERDSGIPFWLRDLSDSNLLTTLERHLNSVVPHFRGRFQQWDVNNEMLHGGYLTNRLGAWVRPWMFQQVRALDPDVRLFVNDYDVVEGGLTDQYKQMVQELVASGAEINGLGVQGHFGSSVDADAISSRMDSLAQLGLPLWITEYDSVSADEYARAINLDTLYRMAFSKPSVEGILMWSFWAGSHWRGSDAAIVNTDWTLGAAGRRYQALLAEWTTRTNLVTDASGRVRWRGFHGDYELLVTLPNGAVLKRPLSLPTGDGPLGADIVLDPREAPLVPAGALWQYLDTGAVPPSNWNTLAFQEASWPSGPAQLGFGGGDEATLINSNRSRVTTYFRRAFTVDEPGLWTGLLLRLLREDGAVVYLNGTEILRSNLPPGPLLASTFALTEANRSDGTTNFYTTAVDLSLLRRGLNVLAVEIHQCGTNNPGLSFDLELLGTQSTTPPKLTATLAGAGFRLTWPAWGLDFTLYSASNLTPPVAWSPVANAMSLSSGLNTISVDAMGESRFFRLQRQ